MEPTAGAFHGRFTALREKNYAGEPSSARKPDTVIPVKEIGLGLYPDDEAVGLQFEDGAGKQVFLWLPGSLLCPWEAAYRSRRGLSADGDLGGENLEAELT